MDDIISREKAIETIQYRLCQGHGNKEHICKRGSCAYCGIMEIMNDIENIEAADVKHGRWIEKPPYKDETVKGLEFQIVCSECDEQNSSLEFDENYNAIGKTFYRTRYCPNCGARMDGDKTIKG